MKSINTHIQERLVVSKTKQQTPEHEGLWGQIEMALPQLEDEMKDILGAKTDALVRNFDFGLTVTEKLDRYKNAVYEITSEDLVPLTGPLGKLFYERFMFATWAGKVDEKEQKIWFNPKFNFKYVGGGSNGNDAFWNSLWFDIETGQFEFGNRI